MLTEPSHPVARSEQVQTLGAVDIGLVLVLVAAVVFDHKGP